MYPLQTNTLIPNTNFPERGGQIGCISGYISNPNTTTAASVLIYGINNTGKITRSIAPNGYLVFRSLEFERIMNISAFNLEIVYSQNNDFLLEESQALVGINNTVDVTFTNTSIDVTGTVDIGTNNTINIGSITSGVTIPVSVSNDITFTNTSIAVTGTVDIGTNNTINIGSITSGVTIPVSVSNDITFTNTSIAVTGTVDIGTNNTINIGSITSGVTIPVSVSNDITFTNTSIAVTGTVSIGGTADINISSISSGVTIPVSQQGDITITNSSFTVSGTVDIGNTVDINISTQSGNVAVNLVESINLPRGWTLGSSDNPILSHGSPEVTATLSSTGVTPAAGIKWTLLAAYIYFESNGTSPGQASITIARGNNVVQTYFGYELLAYINASTVTSGEYFYGVGSVSAASGLTFGKNVTAVQWSERPIIYPGDYLYGYAGNANVTPTLIVMYTTSNI